MDASIIVCFGIAAAILFLVIVIKFTRSKMKTGCCGAMTNQEKSDNTRFSASCGSSTIGCEFPVEDARFAPFELTPESFSEDWVSQKEVCAKMGITLSGLLKIESQGKIKASRQSGKKVRYRMRKPNHKILQPVAGYRCGNCFIGNDGYIYDGVDLFMDVIYLAMIIDMIGPECICDEVGVPLPDSCEIPLAPIPLEDSAAAEIVSEPEPVVSHSASWMADSPPPPPPASSDYDRGGSDHRGGGSDYDSGDSGSFD